ncbi:uncharacterized protein [Maniola hyperantus]|uniref:uncharacterized protein n=1 Tax=Aphantopus hyperantus TaxID=2795564 RepID=UPI001567F917|nr:uncharacterized protein LOC117988280 [Maniola hyperantus]
MKLQILVILTVISFMCFTSEAQLRKYCGRRLAMAMALICDPTPTPDNRSSNKINQESSSHYNEPAKRYSNYKDSEKRSTYSIEEEISPSYSIESEKSLLNYIDQQLANSAKRSMNYEIMSLNYMDQETTSENSVPSDKRTINYLDSEKRSSNSIASEKRYSYSIDSEERYPNSIDYDYNWKVSPQKARSMGRGKRQIVSECCDKPCSLDELKTYC